MRDIKRFSDEMLLQELRSLSFTRGTAYPKDCLLSSPRECIREEEKIEKEILRRMKRNQRILKAVKKVAAIGTGIAMLGATLTGALA